MEAVEAPTDSIPTVAIELREGRQEAQVLLQTADSVLLADLPTVRSRLQWPSVSYVYDSSCVMRHPADTVSQRRMGGKAAATVAPRDDDDDDDAARVATDLKITGRVSRRESQPRGHLW